ncbi:putative esterase [Mycobacteroides abscessus subsp. abscessus]|nr:putative esterase [Mycobacteroides abscessus subsp. abscessus]
MLALPIAKPGLYKAAAAYSGCAQTSDPVGSEFVKLTVETWGGGDTENMWGPQGSEEWVKNDPYVNAEGLRGLELYISTGNGIPGPYDTLNGPYRGGHQLLHEQPQDPTRRAGHPGHLQLPSQRHPLVGLLERGVPEVLAGAGQGPRPVSAT